MENVTSVEVQATVAEGDWGCTASLKLFVFLSVNHNKISQQLLSVTIMSHFMLPSDGFE